MGKGFKSLTLFPFPSPHLAFLGWQTTSCAKNREEAEVIGSIREIVNGREKCEYVLEKMASFSVHLVTLTI
ncbi:MAG: hypothetical protein RMY16_15075 [Nostoc sp. DedQUE12b]|uniref:hypothetical protein n=1 Tax=Nostoc sp. DedQUE12b TaxID=3075398 RepID=UPI002AD492B7|nr:hypothetical protein [Nostoc sp. DedQUE12b]MDZ8086860.1 hypothetical protein [Nostoc sp. DedQUE12b]